MSHATETNRSAEPNASNPPAVGNAPVPLWMMLLPVMLLFVGALYFDWNGGWFNPSVHAPYASYTQIESWQPVGGQDQAMLLGKLKFTQTCELCHGANGQGKPGQAPTFVGSEWVLTENVNQLIPIPLQGLVGPITVNGEAWNMSMAAMGASLSDEELAAVLSYIRNSWGNEASMVTPEQVAAVREAHAGRTQPWTGPELKALP